MIKSKLTPEGRTVLSILMTEYQMTEQMAVKLMREGGMPLVIAVMTRKKQ